MIIRSCWKIVSKPVLTSRSSGPRTLRGRSPAAHSDAQREAPLTLSLGVRKASETMSNRIRKTEHAGAKNGGGYWGKRHEAKMLSNKIRRAQSRQLEDMEVTEFRSSDQAGEKGKRDEKTNEE